MDTSIFHREIRDLVLEDERNKYTYPMAMIQGMNHVQYITGDTPPEVQQFVIKAEVEDEEARQRTADVTAVFILYTLGQVSMVMCKMDVAIYW